ncbi:MAG: hypothetical protein JO171_00200 [Paludibacterium sp.]|uniref:hypothetical protein n=1 Tax=Paludibacterium sp. TaxID=1917523 RepID=UPI0025DCF357|nr:hypothetical protein [Paludibacterium sp.]MBV8045545.1 hypothetical protein [Paludibacterium sp.]
MSPFLRLELKPGELLVLQLTQPCQARSESGAFWLSIAGEDICLSDRQGASLPRGRLLVEGTGRLTLAWPAAARSVPLRLNGFPRTL